MVINSENKNGLKGLHNLAQGNPEVSGRPGLESEEKNRPRPSFHKGEIYVADENDGLIFPEN